MNRAARRYMLHRLDAASAPLWLAVISPGGPVEGLVQMIKGLVQAIESMRSGGAMVMPLGARIEIVAPRRGPRVVAGKGARRRGVRGRPPPLRLVDWSSPKARVNITLPRASGGIVRGSPFGPNAVPIAPKLCAPA